MSEQDSAAMRIDTTVPHPARRYDYWLGGKDNFAADRASGDAVAAAFPTVRLAALENRRFLRRAVTYLAREGGVRQFLDIGTGIPTANNTHQVAQSIAPESRIVYVDNDPIVLVHARALLTSAPEGATAYLDADLREPEKILADPDLAATVDLSQPIALMMIAILHFVTDDYDPYAVVNRLVGALAPGSFVAMSHGTPDLVRPEDAEKYRDTAAKIPDFRPRTYAEIERFTQGLELVPPGIVAVSEWRAEGEEEPRPSPSDIGMYGLVARVP